MASTADRDAIRRPKFSMNPLRTLVPVNASRNKVVDTRIEVLVFCWQRSHPQGAQAERVDLPLIGPPPDPITSSAAEPQRWSGHLSNSLVPFYTTQRPWETDHRRRSSGIGASQLVRRKGHTAH